jgi:hypothetical protein
VVQGRGVDALDSRIRAPHEEKEVFTIGEELRESMSRFLKRGIRFCEQDGLPARGRNPEQTRRPARQNHTVAIPGPSDACTCDFLGIADRQRSAALQVCSLDLEFRHERDGLAVGRPERHVAPFRSRQGLRLERIKLTQPEGRHT